MKIKLLILISLLTIVCVYSQENTSFNFVQITDTHLGGYDHNKRTKKIVKSINSLPLKIDFVAHTGDIYLDNILSKKARSSAQEIFSELNAPIYFTPGNHDILYKDKKATKKAYIKHHFNIDTVVINKGVALVFVYTQAMHDEESIEYEAKLEWLRKVLKANNDKGKIVFHHIPSVDDFYRNKMHSGWRDDIEKKWIDIINYYNVNAVIAGHFHRGEMHWLDNVPLYVAPSIAGFWNRQASYRIYTYDNGKLSYRSVYIE